MAHTAAVSTFAERVGEIETLGVHPFNTWPFAHHWTLGQHRAASHTDTGPHSNCPRSAHGRLQTRHQTLVREYGEYS